MKRYKNYYLTKYFEIFSRHDPISTFFFNNNHCTLIGRRLIVTRFLTLRNLHRETTFYRFTQIVTDLLILHHLCHHFTFEKASLARSNNYILLLLLRDSARVRGTSYRRCKMIFLNFLLVSLLLLCNYFFYEKKKRKGKREGKKKGEEKKRETKDTTEKIVYRRSECARLRAFAR